jgi:diguanylate cyclase (GGDEF)-like protein
MHDDLIVALLAVLAVLMAAVLAAVLRDKRAVESLRHLAMYDALTELFNRRAFLELAEREIARARRSNAPFAVLMLDLDHFKRINDRHGHPAGDRVLAGFAALLRRCLRAEDLVGRYGGEEFCAVLPGARKREALGVAERIRAQSAKKTGITVSIGVTLCPAGSETSLQSAIARADEALYRAKKSGRNRVVALPLGDAAVDLAA